MPTKAVKKKKKKTVIYLDIFENVVYSCDEC